MLHSVPPGRIWLVYPKGRQTVPALQTESGRAAGNCESPDRKRISGKRLAALRDRAWLEAVAYDFRLSGELFHTLEKCLAAGIIGAAVPEF